MVEGDREFIVPQNWGLKEVKSSAWQAALAALKRSGMRGVAVLAAMGGLVWIAGQIITSNFEGGLKALCLLGICGALLAIAVVALLTEKHDYGTAEETGRDGADQPGTVPGHEGATGTAPTANGSTVDG